ncbi:MAG: MBL fold metallo-hydrolase [Chloroflexi bacterium]|nr:MBL fold metallo-hydrolase [Chloroflexota bacterium]
MTLKLAALSLGPIGANGYIAADSDSGEAVVIDPGGDAPVVMATAKQMGATLKAIWLTHAHFDHWGGVADLVRALDLPVALHSLELPLYRNLGGAKQWGVPMQPGPEPTILLDDHATGRTKLEVGNLKFEVFFVPGHTVGHVAFYEKAAGVIFGGDVLFQGSIGRTDFPGGDFDTLIHSIRTQFLTLPDPTVVLSGHGPQTTVGEERRFNPFLS